MSEGHWEEYTCSEKFGELTKEDKIKKVRAAHAALVILWESAQKYCADINISYLRGYVNTLEARDDHMKHRIYLSIVERMTELRDCRGVHA